MGPSQTTCAQSATHKPQCAATHLNHIHQFRIQSSPRTPKYWPQFIQSKESFPQFSSIQRGELTPKLSQRHHGHLTEIRQRQPVLQLQETKESLCSLEAPSSSSSVREKSSHRFTGLLSMHHFSENFSSGESHNLTQQRCNYLVIPYCVGCFTLMQSHTIFISLFSLLMPALSLLVAPTLPR